MFILSSENFNQAYRRIKYFQQYSSYRKKQVEMIQQTQKIINNKLSTLNNQKTEKVVLLTQKEKEKKKLSIEKEEKDNTISKLKKKEKNLSAMLKKKQREAEKLQKEIEKIITEEIRKSKIPEVKENKTAVDKKPNTISLTPDESIISNNFEINKGRLPWPTEKGVISSSFGEHPHPVHKDVKIKNNGIDILTNKGSYARSIFNGVVTAVISTPNGKKAVIIRHGEYLSVYSNLDDVIVSKGAKVSSKQKIGSIALNSEESSTELHFEIWKNTNFQNPQPWLAGN
jgi:septal ring factor EnvC (AmiA/AmiB activator)